MAALGISVASVTLATLANPLVRYAYEKIVSIQNAKEDLEKLERSLETIKGALLNAEKFEEEPAVKDWIKRVRDVLYDADDLFDEIAIDAELKKLNEVRDSPSDIPFAGMVKDLRKCLDDVVNQNPLSFSNNTIANSVGEIVGKIYQSIFRSKDDNFNLEQRAAKIKEEISGKKFLLILDDVWDESSGRWDARMDTWRRGAKGSKVIVTTRSRSVAKAVGASETYDLYGLSEEKSWDLFKRVARITPEKERDSMWNDLGREFVRKGANVPLAIRSIASLLAEKNTIEEWELFRNNELPKLGQTQENEIMPVLRLSYDHLASRLKPCFAYCSLFPKGHRFDKDDLIDLWASQGYIKTTNDSQRIEDMDDSWADPHPLRLRSFLYEGGYASSCKLTLEKQFANFKCLRALKLSCLRIEIVPSSIGELKHLRYLDVSYNNFKRLPDTITNLVNLCMLNISRCFKLEVLPNQFSKLVNLRGLLNRKCGLKHMPLGFDRLISLQRLDEFIVSRKTDGGQGSNLHELPGLELRNKLSIIFNDETVIWDGVDSWKLCPYLQFLEIVHYRGIRMPNWGNGRRTNEPYLLPTLTSLQLIECSRVKCLPSLRHLPNLNGLMLIRMDELEYIQGDEEEEKLSPNAIFLPDLKKLEFVNLKKLKGWSRKVEEATRSKEEHAATCTPSPPLHMLSFPSLLELTIKECPKLNHMLLCPSLGKLILETVKAKVIHQLLLPIHGNSFPSNTTTPSSSLQSVVIKNCHDLVSFPGESLTSLQRLCLEGCTKLNKVQLAPLGSNILEKLTLWKCPKLELWKENKRGVDWDSLPKLTRLILGKVPSSEKLPDCLRKRQAHFRLTIMVNDSWVDPHPLRLHSFLYKGRFGSSCKLTLEKQFANFKCLRALKLSSRSIEIVPSSIGELKHLRYLDVSYNNFKRLPDAITNLVNLCMLNISRCFKLEVLPNQFSKLVNLRGLLNRKCGLKHMPLGFDRLISLQRLDEFIVSRKTDGGQGSNLHELPGLELRNKLSIIFNDEKKLCPYLQFLEIVHYRGIRMPNWGNGRRTNEPYLLPTLTSLQLIECSRVKCLPSLRHLLNLNGLMLIRMDELEYIQGDEEEEKLSPNAIFLPDLKKLEFVNLKKLKGWLRKVEEATRSKEEHAAT
ncbi:hypothetical protein V2J09_001049 [Rumex salicifolius]